MPRTGWSITKTAMSASSAGGMTSVGMKSGCLCHVPAVMICELAVTTGSKVTPISNPSQIDRRCPAVRNTVGLMRVPEPPVLQGSLDVARTTTAPTSWNSLVAAPLTISARTVPCAGTLMSDCSPQAVTDATSIPMTLRFICHRILASLSCGRLRMKLNADQATFAMLVEALAPDRSCADSIRRPHSFCSGNDSCERPGSKDADCSPHARPRSAKRWTDTWTDPSRRTGGTVRGSLAVRARIDAVTVEEAVDL